MKRKFYLQIELLFLSAIISSITAQEIKEINLSDYFSDISGTFVLYDRDKDRVIISDTLFYNTRFAPASTFKILNGMIGLETGIISDENFIIPWDSVQTSIKEWNRDHTFRSAIKYSVVPYFRELARRIGPERMQSYLDLVNYGNKNIFDGIDKFWLTGSLKISPKEQLEFLKKLHSNNLPFSKRTISIIKDLIMLEKKENYAFYGKTGYTTINDTSIAWLVGFIEKSGNTYFYVSALVGENSEKLFENRKKLPVKILTDLGLITDE